MGVSTNAILAFGFDLGEELPEVMHFGGRIFSPVSAFGMAVLAIKALANRVKQLETGSP